MKATEGTEIARILLNGWQFLKSTMRIAQPKASYDVPAKVLEPVAVTRDNIDEVIIDGGFHRRDEVYLNTDYDTE